MGAIGVVELHRIDDLNALRARFIAEGIFIRPIGNVIYLTPAFTIAPDELEALTDAIVTRGRRAQSLTRTKTEETNGRLHRTGDRHPPSHLAARRYPVAGRSADPAHVRRLFRPAPRLSGRGVHAGCPAEQGVTNRCTSPPTGASTRALDETRWLQAVADQHGFPHGIVCQADMTDPDLERQAKGAEAVSQSCAACASNALLGQSSGAAAVPAAGLLQRPGIPPRLRAAGEIRSAFRIAGVMPGRRPMRSS